jgi:hypothetical protein
MQQKGNPNVLFIAYLKRDELDVVRNVNYHVYCLASAKNHVESVVGYNLKSNGVTIK